LKLKAIPLAWSQKQKQNPPENGLFHLPEKKLKFYKIVMKQMIYQIINCLKNNLHKKTRSKIIN